MTDARKAILEGKKEASRLHRRFSLRERIEEQGGRIDVFDTLVQSGVPLLFKPLDGLLGVFMDDPMPGILVTTKRPLSVQRFTGAHELGHFQFGHKPSLDDAEAILRRSPFNTQHAYAQQEMEADAFATEFMLPPWLFAAHFKQQGWTAAMMSNPLIVYQLSLRVGASYEATCRSLARPSVSVINRNILNSLLRVKRKDIKASILQSYSPPDWWRDVWILTKRDEGSIIEGSRSDLFVLRLDEHSSAGYLWDFDQLNADGFAIVQDERETVDDEIIGSHVTRSITTQSEDRQSGVMCLSEKRPWQSDSIPLSTLHFRYDLNGPEQEGWSQAERRRLLEAA